MSKVDGGGERHNTGKAKVHLNSGHLDFYIARVTEAGMQKYPKDNWRRGMLWSIIVDCIGRHFDKLRNGQFYDEDTYDEAGNLVERGTGLPHLAIIAWNCMAWATYTHTYPEGNDLYVAPGTTPFEKGTNRHGTYLLPELFDRAPVAKDDVLTLEALEAAKEKLKLTTAPDDPFFTDTPFTTCKACALPEPDTAVPHTCILGTARQRETPPDPGTFFQTDGSVQTLDDMPRNTEAVSVSVPPGDPDAMVYWCEVPTRWLDGRGAEIPRRDFARIARDRFTEVCLRDGFTPPSVHSDIDIHLADRYHKNDILYHTPAYPLKWIAMWRTTKVPA